MKLVNNNLFKIENSEKTNLIADDIAFLDAINDLDACSETILTKCDDIANIIRLKHHIGKFGVSDEVLSLYFDEFKQLALLDSDKETALETLEDILEHNGISGASISEELLSAIIMITGTISKSLERATVKFVSKAFGIIRVLKDFERIIKVKNPVLYLTNRTIIVPDYKDYRHNLDVMTHISSELRQISPDGILKSGNLELLLEFKKLGYDFTTDGKLVVKPTRMKERRTLQEAKWTELDITKTLSDCIKFEKYLNNYKYLSKKLQETYKKLKPSGNDGDIDRAEYKQYRRNLKIYKLVTKLCMLEANKLLFTMVAVCRAVIKKV